MATIKRIEDLECWKQSRQFCEMVNRFILQELFSRDYALKNQLNSSSGSVMDNIAEGFERNGNKEFVQFLTIAKGSAGESRSQLYRALDRKFITKSEFDAALNPVELISGKIQSLMSYLINNDFKGTKFITREDTPEYGNAKLNFESETLNNVEPRTLNFEQH